MSGRELTPMEEDAVSAWLLRNRCCGSPNLCGARCYDDEESWVIALVAGQLDRLREATTPPPPAGRTTTGPARAGTEKTL